MLHSNPKSPATQSPTSPSSTVSVCPPTAARTAPEPPHPAQPKHSVPAAPKCAPISKHSSSQSAGDDSMLLLERHQSAETARRGVSPPLSSKSESESLAKEGEIAGKKAVSLVAKPELYSALTAAVSAIVQQSGLAQCRPAQDCLKGISLQYHAEGQGAQLEGQGAQLAGQTKGVRRQQNCTEGQRAGHEGQQARHETQQQEAFPSSSEAPATGFATSLPSHMASQNSCRQAHHGQVSAQHSTVDVSRISAQHAQDTHHAQHSAADADEVSPTSGQQVACDEGGAAARQEGLAVGPGGLDGGSGHAQAWQGQVEQAMQVLQAALQSSSKAGEPPAAVTTR